MEDVTVETISTLKGFDAIAREWDGLVEAMRRPCPFLLHGYVRAWWEVCGDAAEVAILVARRRGRIAGAFPLHVRRRHGLRVAEFVGGDHAHLADVLLAPDAGADVVSALAQAARGVRCDFADLFGLPSGSVVERLFGLGEIRLLERIEAPVLDLGGDWEAVYRKKASAKTRQTHRRKLRRLGELGRLDIELADAPDTIGPALEETFRVHALRWAGRPDGSGLAAAPIQEFQRRAYTALAGSGVARILSFKLDGRTIAYNCYLILQNRLYSHRLAFDPAYGRWSPGLLCTLTMCERAVLEGLERVEFLGGDEDYKLQLADRLEPLMEGFALADTVRGRAAVARRLATVRARRRLKRLPALHRLYLEGFGPARRTLSRLRGRSATAS